MEDLVLRKVNEELVNRYLELVAADDYRDFGALITDDCQFALMPIGHTFRGRQDVMAFVQTAGGSRAHDQSSKVTITNWFGDGDYVCVEYVHRFVVFPKSVRFKGKIDGYCLVFHIRDGKFDVIREYINPSNIVTALLVMLLLRLLPVLTARRKH
jgi:ketosteroid isomerase-like protein